MAAAMVKGIQSQHIAATVKHFALNNKETNRKDSDSRVSERAAREIYLKPFELIVKEADPWSIMSSYNIINGCRASENRELLEDILRDEWGFKGMVTTDWWTNGEQDKR
jgi:beta-glucosidase